MCYRRKEEVRRMSEKLYRADQFYPGDFAQILTGVYSNVCIWFLYMDIILPLLPNSESALQIIRNDGSIQ